MSEAQEKWYHHIWFVVMMLIVAGPFAFPLLWKSPKLSRGAKWALTLLFTILTLLAIWLSVETFRLIWKHVQELQAALY